MKKSRFGMCFQVKTEEYYILWSVSSQSADYFAILLQMSELLFPSNTLTDRTIGLPHNLSVQYSTKYYFPD